MVEKEAMEISTEDLQKKLELSEDWLLQSSSQILQTLAQMHILKRGSGAQHARTSPVEDHLEGTEESPGRSFYLTSPSWAN
jgi:hypothetical protein